MEEVLLFSVSSRGAILRGMLNKEIPLFLLKSFWRDKIQMMQMHP